MLRILAGHKIMDVADSLETIERIFNTGLVPMLALIIVLLILLFFAVVIMAWRGQSGADKTANALSASIQTMAMTLGDPLEGLSSSIASLRSDLRAGQDALVQYNRTTALAQKRLLKAHDANIRLGEERQQTQDQQTRVLAALYDNLQVHEDAVSEAVQANQRRHDELRQMVISLAWKVDEIDRKPPTPQDIAYIKQTLSHLYDSCSEGGQSA